MAFAVQSSISNLKMNQIIQGKQYTQLIRRTFFFCFHFFFFQTEIEINSLLFLLLLFSHIYTSNMLYFVCFPIFFFLKCAVFSESFDSKPHHITFCLIFSFYICVYSCVFYFFRWSIQRILFIIYMKSRARFSALPIPMITINVCFVVCAFFSNLPT